MGKVKKVIIGLVITALVGTGISGGLMYARKGSQKEVLVASVSDLAGERYDSDTTLSGNVYANATQRITIDKDMIIEEVYVSKGDEVKPGDKLISFDMTLVEMELNIAKLKLQKQQQDLATAKKRLTSLQNGGPILDSDASSADNLIDSGEDSGIDSGTDSGTDSGDDSLGDDEMSSANVTASDHRIGRCMPFSFSRQLQCTSHVFFLFLHKKTLPSSIPGIFCCHKSLHFCNLCFSCKSNIYGKRKSLRNKSQGVKIFLLNKSHKSLLPIS